MVYMSQRNSQPNIQQFPRPGPKNPLAKALLKMHPEERNAYLKMLCAGLSTPNLQKLNPQ
jgi:hypothetical protein